MKTIFLRHATDISSITEDTRLEVCHKFIHNYGLGYYITIWKNLKNQFPHYIIHLSIPCGHNVGLAMNAMKAQVTQICFGGDKVTLQKLMSMAASYGVTVAQQ